jgi:penicillin-binding protein 1B
MATRPPSRPTRRPARAPRWRILVPFRRRWVRIALIAAGVPALALIAAATYFWITYGRLIDSRFAGEQQPVARIFGRPFEIAVGRGMSPAQLGYRLNDLGYSERERADEPGEFTIAGTVLTLHTRPEPDAPAQVLKLEFSRAAAPILQKITTVKGTAVREVTLEAPLLAALAPGEKRRHVPLARIPEHVRQAVLAIEDQRFFAHPGVDPIRTLGAIITNVRGDRPYLVGGSTLTQQFVKNTFLTPEKTPQRKLQEQFMALVLESRFTKEQILELYLNDIVLGQRGPFAIRGVAEAARIFFGKDVSNVTLPEAATLAGMIQAPSRLSPFSHPQRATERRNLVLNEMADAGFITAEAAAAARKEPLKLSPRAMENEAPFFVDYVGQLVDESHAGLIKKSGSADVYTTLDLHLQRIAQEAVATGITQLDKQLARRKPRVAQVALVAVDPRTGDILAMVGGRAYSQSQYNRAVTTRRQPGSVFKPFVYLAAFERTANEGYPFITPASVVIDEPTIFKDGEKDYTPANYQDEYDGPITLRRALALSRNIVAIKVAESIGYDHVADFWTKVGVGTPAKPYPSIALGVFEMSLLEVAQAYTLFTNQGSVRPLRAITRLVQSGKAITIEPDKPRSVAHPETTYLVTNLMRSVINEGTGASARATFALDAAGKSGTTNDLRDAWFVGFTPELLTAVWVGFDDNYPIGLGGSQAALPIWTNFMRQALAGRRSIPFEQPDGIETVEIDRDTGKLPTPECPRRINETFLTGTAPVEICDVHGSRSRSLFARIGGWFKRIRR